MKNVNHLLKTIVFSVCIFGLSNAAIAQKIISKPSKQVNCSAIDLFVNEAFNLYARVNSITTTIETVESQLSVTTGPNLSLLSQLNESTLALKGLLPNIQALISSSKGMPENIKSVSVLRIPLALKNIKAAAEVLVYSGKQVSSLLDTAIPNAKRKVAAMDSTNKADSINISKS